MVEVFVDRDLDREIQGIATTRHQSNRPGCGHDTTVAGTPILATLDELPRVLVLEDGDFLVLLKLSSEGLQNATTNRAPAVTASELMDLFDLFKPQLSARAMALRRPILRLGGLLPIWIFGHGLGHLRLLLL
jgi:hypothetical protein